jgi:hypothetical protein
MAFISSETLGHLSALLFIISLFISVNVARLIKNIRIDVLAEPITNLSYFKQKCPLEFRHTKTIILQHFTRSSLIYLYLTLKTARSPNCELAYFLMFSWISDNRLQTPTLLLSPRPILSSPKREERMGLNY